MPLRPDEAREDHGDHQGLPRLHPQIEPESGVKTASSGFESLDALERVLPGRFAGTAGGEE
jgi:hypothetical protein